MSDLRAIEAAMGAKIPVIGGEPHAEGGTRPAPGRSGQPKKAHRGQGPKPAREGEAKPARKPDAKPAAKRGARAEGHAPTGGQAAPKRPARAQRGH